MVTTLTFQYKVLFRFLSGYFKTLTLQYSSHFSYSSTTNQKKKKKKKKKKNTDKKFVAMLVNVVTMLVNVDTMLVNIVIMFL